MNIVLLAQVMKRSAAAATSRSRRILTLVCCLVLFVLVFRFPTVQVCYATNSTEEPIAMLPGKNQQNHNMSHCHEISVTMYDTFHIMRPICSPVLNQKRCAYMFIYIYIHVHGRDISTTNEQA